MIAKIFQDFFLENHDINLAIFFCQAKKILTFVSNLISHGLKQRGSKILHPLLWLPIFNGTQRTEKAANVKLKGVYNRLLLIVCY